MDGSQKIPQRWLETLTTNAKVRHSCPAILTGLSAWIAHSRDWMRSGDDPLAAQFALLWQCRNTQEVAEALFGSQGKFSAHWIATPDELATIAEIGK